MDPHAADKVLLLLRLGRLREAERAARELIAAEPESFPGYYYFAQALLRLGRYEEAWAVSKTVLARVPDWCPAHIQRSLLLQITGHLSESVEAAETAVRLDHTNPDAHLRLAISLAAAGRDRDAETVIAAARKLFPDHTGILYQAGVVALDAEATGEVSAVAERGLALDPANPAFHYLAGIAAGELARTVMERGLQRQHWYREAERLLADAVRLEPTNATYRDLRKRNAAASRTDIIAYLMTGWLFGMILGVIVLPIVLRGVSVPCCCWLVLPLGVCRLGIVCHGRCPEFSLVMPLPWFDVVTIPLLPEERRKGFLLWAVFLAATAAALFLPMLFVAVHPSAQITPAPTAHAR